MKKHICFPLILLILISLFSCSSDSNNNADETTQEELNLGYFPNTTIPFILSDLNDYTVFAYDSNIDSTIDGIILKKGDDEALTMIDTETYLPSAISVSDGSLVLFNYNDELTAVDVVFQYEDGSQVFVIVNTDSEQLNFNNQNGTDKNGMNSVLEAGILFFDVASFVTSTVTCIVSTAATVSGVVVTGPLAAAIGVPTAIISCTSAVASFLDLLNTANPNDPILPNTVTTFQGAGLAVDVLECGTGNPVGCFAAGTQASALFLEGLENVFDEFGSTIILYTYDWRFGSNFNIQGGSTDSFNASLCKFKFGSNNSVSRAGSCVTTYGGSYSHIGDALNLSISYELYGLSLTFNGVFNEMTGNFDGVGTILGNDLGWSGVPTVMSIERN